MPLHCIIVIIVIVIVIIIIKFLQIPKKCETRAAYLIRVHKLATGRKRFPHSTRLVEDIERYRDPTRICLAVG